MKQLIQCVPNFSEGQNKEAIEAIVDCFRGRDGLQLLDYSSDADHNRTVVTLVGEPEALEEAVVAAMGVAAERIDLRTHEGQHPRMGATDVVPFVPIENASLDDCVALSKRVAERAFSQLAIPIFLYEASASAAHRKNLAKLRKGQFEKMAEKIQEPEWAPDYGTQLHPSAGITAVGARMPLVAFNVNLNTSDLAIADRIAKNVRHLSGGLRYCKAMGVALEERGIVQVSMNMTNFEKTPLYRVFELIRIEAKRYGVEVVGSEVIGLVPMAALLQTAEYYLGIEHFEMDQVLEKRMRDA